MHRLIHDPNNKPNIGIYQPALGAKLNLAFSAMGRAAKTPKPHMFIMRGVLASNVRALMDRKYGDIEKETNRIKALAKEGSMGHGSVQRALAGKTGLNIDLIERLALALDVSVYQILLPNLDADNPQVVSGADKQELLLYASMKRVAAGLPSGNAPKKAGDIEGKPSVARKKDIKRDMSLKEPGHNGQ